MGWQRSLATPVFSLDHFIFANPLTSFINLLTLSVPLMAVLVYAYNPI